jgi:hypothetical protein
MTDPRVEAADFPTYRAFERWLSDNGLQNGNSQSAWTVFVAGWLAAADAVAPTVDRDTLVDPIANIRTHNGTPVTVENLRWAATHEALCRSWIFDVLTGLADLLTAGVGGGTTFEQAQAARPPADTEGTD